MQKEKEFFDCFAKEIKFWQVFLFFLDHFSFVITRFVNFFEL